MTQLHRRFTDDQIKVLLNGYCQGLLGRGEIQEILETGKLRFFALLKEYRQDPEAFSVAYERHTPGRLPAGGRLDYHGPDQKRTTHDREALTVSIGAPFQGESSLNPCSPPPYISVGNRHTSLCISVGNG
jgi:hypothetical protein